MSILLASSNTALITYWEESIFGLSSTYLVNNPKHFKDRLNRTNPDLLLLDYAFLGKDVQKEILNVTSSNLKLKIIIFVPEIDDNEEWALFKNGVRGCCHYDIDSEQIIYAVKAVQKGELWIRRSLTSYMLQELVEVTLEKDRIETAIHDLLTNLTKREYEIATLVGRGESNKRIANKLDITERTVKAHLTEIFRKLQITDRIKLALMMKDTVTSLKPPHVNHTFHDPTFFA
ncbi:DNA-binding response regulator, NarL/FixJ family, contains REC and HTH domains [Nitrosomonas sp. Nm51]|uniref:LuxR C-terminal-related transcriptional regulator n=1 Tax=Nitrosomonas sp. Nm51 TaxID=133720 RepID=UPI0008D5D394|nr:response regulator transcription factor [Nitrosomonas sp. Nm51]SER44228.1 DNA-binding response regulator, NarL/FixJ family, contains REC and HTH domains [Nitrosomonas sp. Nm51]